MARKSGRSALVLLPEQEVTIKELAASRTAPLREVQRARDFARLFTVHDARPHPVYAVSVDEKPGIQAIGLTAPDLSPVPDKASTFSRDYEYVRRGTLSLLAGIDLHSGHIFAAVEDRHRSVEFIGLLKQLDEHYPPEAIIRVVLDNHSAHISKRNHDLPWHPSWKV